MMPLVLNFLSKNPSTFVEQLCFDVHIVNELGVEMVKSVAYFCQNQLSPLFLPPCSTQSFMIT
jgi:hypothetical protein